MSGCAVTGWYGRLGQFKQGEGSAWDWLTDRVIRTLIGFARLLPWSARLKVMSWLIRRVVAPLAGFRDRALMQIALVWPEISAADSARIADGVADNVGRTLIETWSGRELAKRLAETPLTGAGLEALQQARETGRPVIFISGHFGNHEVPRHVLHHHGYTVGGLYRPMANPFFNAHYVRTMERVSGPIFPQGPRGLAGFLRHLKDGGMAVLFFDVWDRSGGLLPFLGKPAPTAYSAAEIALRTDALLIPYAATRNADGQSFTVEVEAPIPEGTPEEMMRQANDRLSARVTRTPEQWFWFHRRWKPRRKL